MIDSVKRLTCDWCGNISQEALQSEDVYAVAHQDGFSTNRNGDFCSADCAVQSQAAEGTLIQDKLFCFTGHLRHIGRIQARKMVTLRGGRWSKHLSKFSDYLVVGERAGSKLVKAQKLGIAILTQVEFMEMYIGTKQKG